MATNASVKMGVTGVSKFKADMNQAKQAVKTLDAQLALTEKQFKQSGDAESYMTEKAELLKAKLEQQKSALASAEKALEQMAQSGVDKASKAYQDMYRSMLQVKGEMIDTENAINGVADSTDKAADNVSDLSNQLSSIDKGVRLENVTNGIEKITGALSKAATKAYELGKKIVNEVLGAGSWADDLQTRAAYYGLTPEQLQRMDKTAQLIDTSTETIISAQKKLRKGMGSGDEGVMGAFAALFGEGYDPNKNGWEQAFWDAGQALMKFTNEEEREVYAQKLFGRSWNELIPLFEAGKEQYDELNESWKIVSQEQIDSLGKMDDEYQKLQANWETFKIDLLSAFSGPMTQGMEKLNELMARFIDYVNSPEGQEMLESISNTLIEGLEWIMNNWETVRGGIIGIGAAFAGLKLAELGTNVWRVVDGLGKLVGMGGGSAAGAAAGKAVGNAGGSAAGGAAASAAAKATVGTGIKGAISAAAVPAGVLTAALLPALLAQGEAERNWEAQRKYRMNAAGRLGGTEGLFLQQAAAALNNQHSFSSDSFNLLMGLQGADTISRARLFTMLSGQATGYGNYATDELLRLWESGGEGWDQGRIDALLTTVADSYARMSETAAETNEGADKVKDGGDAVTDAAKDMSKIPEQTAAAVTKALNNSAVVIDGGQLSAVVGSYMADLMANWRAG